MNAMAENCPHCELVGATLSGGASLQYGNKQLEDSTMYGHTPSMGVIDTRTVQTGRYFTDVEDRHASEVCLIGDRVAQEFFQGVDPLGRAIIGTRRSGIGTRSGSSGGSIRWIIQSCLVASSRPITNNP